MRILYVINTGLMGGLQMHVKCLMQALKGIAETVVAINVEIDPQLLSTFEQEGLKVYRLGGRSGHDWRVVGRFKKVLTDFKPDVIHAHGLPFFCAVWLLCSRIFKSSRSLASIPILHSIHTTPSKPRGKGYLESFVLNRLVDYWLPVSTPTWAAFKKWHPKAKGEVFFNPLRLSDSLPQRIKQSQIKQLNNFTIGMVGRDADVKDWPSFHRVESIVKSRLSQLKQDLPLFASQLRFPFLNAGEKGLCNGREEIAKMDLFLMTSKMEAMPTTVLECFALGTPICGFIPVGGMADILGFSNGPVRDAFIAERSCEKLADIAMDLMQHPEKRQAMVEDGRRILEHFDAEKNCRGRLIEIYQSLI